MSISSIPSTFLPGFRNLLTTNTLQLLWNNRSTTEKQQLTKQASIGAPPANFLPNPNITSLAREAAWFSLTDAQRATYGDGTAGGATLGSLTNGNAATTYQTGGFGSQTTTTPTATTPLDFTAARLDALSQTPPSDVSAAYRTIWKDNFSTTNVLKANGSAGDTNGGAIFVSIRAGTGAERVTNPYTDDTTRTDDNYDLFEKQTTSLAKSITDRFGQSEGLLGYDTNGNGYLDNESELFGFDGTTAGPSLSASGLLSDRFMVLTSAGKSVKVDQSIFGTARDSSDGYLPYTTAYTTLQRDGSGKLELVVGSTAGIQTPKPAPAVAFVGSPSGFFATGQTIDIAVTFNRDVTVTGTDSKLALDIGGVARQADFLSASGATAIFRYTVTAADDAPNGLTIPANALTLNSTTIRDVNNADVGLTFAASTNPLTVVGNFAPTITGTTIPTGNYNAGDTIDVVVAFDRPIVVTGTTSTLTLQVGGGGTEAAAFLSSTGNTATYRYTVQPGDTDGDGIAVQPNPITLNGSTIRNTQATDATLTFAGATNAAALVDTTAPTVSSLTLPAPGATPVGTPLSVSLNLSEPVTLTGTNVTIGLLVNGVSQTGTITTAPGAGLTALTFSYTVAAGDQPGSGFSVVANSLTVGTGSAIADAFGNLINPNNPADAEPGIIYTP
jgi:hypothetical protein